MFSSPSFAKWTNIGTSVNGDTYYVDFERIKKQGGFVYYWSISDFSKPSEYGDLSTVVYKKVDCELFRYKYLSDSYYKESMGEGETTSSSNKPDKEWKYAPPNSLIETALESVCSQ